MSKTNTSSQAGKTAAQAGKTAAQAGKTARRGRAPSTIEDIRRLLGAPVEVEAAGLRLRLMPPSTARALAVREAVFADAQDENSGGAMFQASLQALQACLTLPLSEEESAQLMLRTGGEAGAPAREALALCGLGALAAETAEEEGAGELDPLPFSSPASADKA